MPLFKRKKKEPEPPKERHLVKEVFFVRGTNYYQDNMMRLAIPNEKYGSAQPAEDYVKVFRYNFRNKPLTIDDDPDYKGQIRILVDGLKIGVLDIEDSDKMRDILRHEVKYITVHMNDGPYKLISPSGAVEEMDSRIHAKLSVGYVEVS